MLENYTLCDVGLKRTSNEDKLHASSNLIVVADGMGGYEKGEVASEYAVEIFKSVLLDTTSDVTIPDTTSEDIKCDFSEHIIEATKQTADKITKYCKENNITSYVGTTIVGILYDLYDNKMYVFHLGDSRAYILRGGIIQKLTVDHTKYEYMRTHADKYSEEEIENVNKNQITKAILSNQYFDPEINTFVPQNGDIYFLCSDGVSDLCNDREIEDIIMSNLSNFPVALDLIKKMVYDRGAKDNLSIILSEYKK